MPRLNAADAAPRLLLDDAADRERAAADQEAVADPDAKLRQKLGANQGAEVPHQIVGVRRAALQDDAAVERKAGLDAAQLDHPRDRRAPISAHHRRRLDRLLPIENRRAREPLLERRADLRRPGAVALHEDIGRNRRARLAG